MTKGSKEKEIKRLLREYYRETSEGLYALCYFIENEKPELLKKFKKYLVDEKILRRSDDSIFNKYVYKFETFNIEEKLNLTYSIRALVLEDFLHKHL